MRGRNTSRKIKIKETVYMSMEGRVNNLGYNVEFFSFVDSKLNPAVIQMHLIIQ